MVLTGREYDVGFDIIFLGCEILCISQPRSEYIECAGRRACCICREGRPEAESETEMDKCKELLEKLYENADI